MDAETINLLLTALTAAAAAGVTTSVKDIADDATKGTYRAIVSGVVKLLRGGAVGRGATNDAVDVEPEDLVESFQQDPDRWRDTLTARLKAVAGVTPLTEALEADAEEQLLRQGLVLFLNNNGVQYGGVQQTNYFGVQPDRTRSS